MTTNPKDLREGDRVRITLEGEVAERTSMDGVYVRFIGGSGASFFTIEELRDAEITRLDPPIRVGDRVIVRGIRPGCVKAVLDKVAWVLRDGDEQPSTEPLASLTRISEES